MPFVPYGSLSQQPQEEYDLAASLQSPEPVINPGPKTASGTKVFGVAAKQNIGGAAGGLLGAAGAGALAGTFAGGPIGTVGGFAVGLGGALLGSYLGNEAQAAIDPTYEEDAQWLAEQYPEHKWAAIGGALAPNLIGMRPSLAPLKQLGTIRGTLAKQKAGGALGGSSWRNLTAEQQNALLNVGAGVGLGVAPSVNNLVQGRDVDIAELLAGVGSGALLTQPWGVARKLGMHPSLSPEQEYAAIHDLVVAKSLQDAPAPVIPDQAIPQIDPQALAQEELLQRGLRGFIAPTDLPGAPVPTVSDDGVLTLIKPSHTKSTITEEGKAKNVRVPAEQVGNPEALPIGYNLRAAKGSQKAAVEKAAMQEWEALLDAETRNKAEARKLARSEEQFSPGAEMRDEVPTLGEARAAEYLREKNKIQSEDYHKAYARLARETRGVETTEADFPEAGKFTPAPRGPGKIETGKGRGFGTGPHEQTHAAAWYLKSSPRKQDNRLHELTIKAIQNDPKYKAWKAAADEQNARKGWKYSTEPEEYWAREAGAAKDLRVFDETPEVRNQRDRETATRVVDGTASVDDYVRYANNLMQYGPSFQTVMQRYGGKFGQLNAPIQQSSISAQTPDEPERSAVAEAGRSKLVKNPEYEKVMQMYRDNDPENLADKYITNPPREVLLQQRKMATDERKLESKGNAIERAYLHQKPSEESIIDAPKYDMDELRRIWAGIEKIRAIHKNTPEYISEAELKQASTAKISDDTDKLSADMFKAKALGLEPGAKLSERRAAMKELAQQHIEKYPDAQIYEDYPKDFQNILNQLRGKGSASTQRDREMTAAKVETEALAAGKTAEEAKALAEAEKSASVRTRGFEPREWNAAAKAKVAEHTLTPELFGDLRAYVRRRIQKQQGHYNDLEGDVYLSPQDVDHLVEQSMWDLTEGRWSEAKGSEGKMPEFIASQKPNTRDFNNTLRDQLYRIGDNKLKTWRKENKLEGGVELDKVQVDTEGRIYRPDGSEDAATSPDLEARTDTAEERDLRDIYEKSLDPESRYYQWTAAPEEFNRAFLNLQKRIGLFRNFGIHEINAFKRRLLNPFDESSAKVSARHRDELGKFQLAAEEVWNMPQDEQTAFLSGWRKRVQQNTKLTTEAKLAAERAVADLAKQFEQRWHPMNRVELEQQAKELAAEKAFKNKWKTQHAYELAEKVEAGPKPLAEDVPLGRTYEDRGFKPGEELPELPGPEAITFPEVSAEVRKSFARLDELKANLDELASKIAKLREAHGVLNKEEKIAGLRRQWQKLNAELGAIKIDPEFQGTPSDKLAEMGVKNPAAEQEVRARTEELSAERQDYENRLQESRDASTRAGRKKWQRAQEQYSPAAAVPDSPEFKRWFGDSKVVDENGKPMVVYHNSRNPGFNIFDPEMGTLGANFFSPTPENFTGYRDIKGTYPVYISMKNPRYVTANKTVGGLKTEKNGLGYYTKEGLIKAGYDGLIGLEPTADGDRRIAEIVSFDPNQIKSATGNSGAFDPSNPDIRYSISSMVPDLFKAEIDLVKRLDPDLGKAFERADRSRARLTGYLNNEPLHLLQNELALKPEGRDNKTFLKDLLANDSPDHRYVTWYRDQEFAGKKPSAALTPRQQRIYDAVELINKRTYDEREKNPLTKHGTKQKAGYLPGMMDLKIAREIEVNRSGKIAQDAIKAQEDWLAAEYGRGSKEFKDRMGRFLGAFDKKQMNSAEQFGPIDLNEGIGLAPELRDKNLNRLMSRFARRFAERMAFANEVQSDKKAMARLQDDKVSLKSNPHVKNVLDRMNGVTEEQEEVRMAISGAIRSMMLQTKTGLGDVTTSFPITMKHLSAKQLGGAGMAWARGAYEGLTRKGDLFRETLRQGINVDNSTTMEMGEDTSKNIANVLNGVRNITNKATGRNWLEQISRAGVYEEGKWLATENIRAVLDGTANAQQKKFVDDFFDKPEFTPEAIKEAATRFVETNQGTYGYRGLPSMSEKGSLAPFLSLSRWNIEQMNNFDKFVFQPALKGNYEPLLMATLGALIGGAAVEQLYEIVSNRKSRLPTRSEIGASKQHVKGTLYKLAGLASLSGFAGFYGDIARTVGDVNFGNRAQGLTNPLWNGMQDFAGIVSDFTMAVADGNIEDAMTQIFPVLLQTYVQDARLLMAHADDAEMNRRDSFRDVRMFNALNEGSVTRAIADQPNPFTNVGLRKFKKTSDLNEAAELLPGLLEGAVGRSGGDPEKIDQEFGKLKANSYQTMPSPQRRPLEFARYMEYLTKTQGPEAAAERFVDYQKQNAINQAKTAMVP